MDIDQKYPYHNLSWKETLEKVSGREEGLSSDEAKERQEIFGKNKLPEKGGTNPLLLFLKQFKDLLIFILFIAAAVAWWANQMADVYIILAVIIFNAIMGFTQEYKAEKAIKAIKKMQQKSALVFRDNKKKEINSEDVVPGDIIILNEGHTIPADGRIIKTAELRTSESLLTGESMPIEKEIESLEKDAPIGDRKNMAWSSTNVVNGKGRAVVTAIGNNTEIGKIAKSMGEMEMRDSNFKKKTNYLGKQMAVIAVATAIIIFSLGYWVQGFGFQEILLVTIAVLVSTIPEGLPAVISIVLAIGANKMAKKNALIREFTATEMMGSISVILVDKTGTLTQSILVIQKLFTGSGKEISVTGDGYNLEGKFKENDHELKIEEYPVEKKLITIAAFCNDAGMKGEDEDNREYNDQNREKENREIKSSETKKNQTKQKAVASDFRKSHRRIDQIAKEKTKENHRDQKSVDAPEVRGDPTEAAMFVIGEKAKIKEKEPYKNYKILDDLPFKSEQKFRASKIETEEGPEIFVIGAPENILELSTQYLTPKGIQDLDEEKRKEFEDKMDEWADQAMRVLALGFKKSGNTDSISAKDVKNIVWVGIAGIIDPPREGVTESIEECKKAGIRVVMVTGDHQKTATAIAKEVGILAKEKKKEGEYPEALTTKELEVDDQKFDQYIKNINVFARMNPETKLRIAERLQEKDTLVAMTGDGVNDAPALKRADVGIAMGQRGTDVAKDAAKIVLQDDNFRSIVNAIREGRIVFNNVKITSYFLLTTNFAFAIAFIFSISIGWPLLFTAAQILYVNLITDGIMDIALATEPGHGNIMKQAPVKKNERILDWEVAPIIVVVSIVMVTLTLLTFWYYLPQGEIIARTATFIIVSSTQLFNAYNMRSLRLSVFEIGVFGNLWVNIAFTAAIILQIIVVKIPFFQDLLRFKELPLLDIIILILLSATILGAGELYKYLRFKKELF